MSLFSSPWHLEVKYFYTPRTSIDLEKTEKNTSLCIWMFFEGLGDKNFYFDTL